MNFLILESTPDAEYSNLRGKGYSGSLVDMQMEYLDSLGHKGTINDRIKSFLSGGGNPLTDNLTLTSEAPVGSVIDITNALIDRTSDVVLAASFTGLTGTGYIVELGGSGSGAAAGFASDGDFIVVASGAPANLTVPAASAPSGDGDLVVELEIGATPGIRAWWVETDGTVNSLHDAAGATTSGSIGSTWTGNDDGKYLGDDSYWATASIKFSLIDSTQTVDYTTAGNLRHYAAQLVTAA